MTLDLLWYNAPWLLKVVTFMMIPRVIIAVVRRVCFKEPLHIAIRLDYVIKSVITVAVPASVVTICVVYTSGTEVLSSLLAALWPFIVLIEIAQVAPVTALVVLWVTVVSGRQVVILQVFTAVGLLLPLLLLNLKWLWRELRSPA